MSCNVLLQECTRHNVSGDTAMRDLLDPDEHPRGGHEPSVQGPRYHVVPIVEAHVDLILLESSD
jgi:hypothetical protein